MIPCRHAAGRLPGKPLADIHGRPMVAWVVDRARSAQRVSRIIVATDHDGIAAAAHTAGAEVMLTRSDHQTGSDRVAEVLTRLALPDDDVIINVQGDEPLVDPADIDAVLACMDDPAVQVATAAAPLDGDPSDPARVKVVFDLHGRALYFSRAPVPHGGPFHVHLGLYAFRAAALLRFAALPRGAAEQQERLEQLRLLEHGIPIQVASARRHLPSVDTPEDLDRVRAILAAGA